MKKSVKKIIMILALIGIVSPFNNNVFAIDPDDETNTVVTGGESGKKEDEKPEPTPAPTPTPIPTEDPSKSEAYLKDISIDGVTFNEKFDKDSYKYTATVTSSTKRVDIKTKIGAGSLDDNSDTRCSLSNDVTDCKVTVVSENGKVSKTYIVSITKATENLNLKSLSIIGIPLNEEFKSSNDTYTAEVSYNVKSLTIDAVPEDSECTVTVSSNASNLSVGKTTIKITVKNKALESNTYRIVVNRLTEDESIGDDDNTNASSSFLDDDNNNTSSNTVIITDNKNNKDDGSKANNNMVSNVLIILICALLLLVAGIGIYFYIVTGNSEKNRMRKIAKLKKKQAKIEEQLTGLMPVITEEESNRYLEKHNVEEKNINIEKKDSLYNVEDTIVVEEPEEISTIDDTLGNTIEIPNFKEDDDELDFRINQEIPNADDSNNRTEKDVLDDFDDLFDE